jgi:nitroreductase
MTTNPLAAWSLQAQDYPRTGTVAERMRFLLGYAILAPSGHNTQPWLFRIRADGVDLIADRTRCLPVVDPHDRALVISCGAALGHLCTAMRHFGHEPLVQIRPDPAEPDLLARATLGPAAEPSHDEVARFEAIVHRRTTRLRYADEPVDADLRQGLLSAAAQHGVELAVIEDMDRKQAIAKLVAAGDRAQFADPAFRRELASWVHSRRSATLDGMSGSAFGMPDVLSAAGGLVIRTFDMGNGQGAKDEALATGAPALLVLATPTDETDDWLRAGMALSAILLSVTAAGWTSAYLNQPVEMDTLRPLVRAAAAVEGHPQLLFRIGRAKMLPAAVRRPVAAVLVE